MHVSSLRPTWMCLGQAGLTGWAAWSLEMTGLVFHVFCLRFYTLEVPWLPFDQRFLSNEELANTTVLLSQCIHRPGRLRLSRFLASVAEGGWKPRICEAQERYSTCAH